MKTVVRQNWIESERNWGIRPDGYSLHLSVKDCTEYIDEYRTKQPHDIPDEYSRPDGQSYLVDIDEKTYDEITNTKNGLRRWC
jgi:hypothetical protein